MKQFVNIIFAFLFVFISIFAVLIFAGAQKNEQQYSFYHYRYRLIKASNDAPQLRFSECFQPRLFEYLQGAGVRFSAVFLPTDGEEIQYFGHISVDVGAEELEERSGRSAEYFSLSRESRGVYYISSDADIEQRLSELLDLKLDRIENRTGFFRVIGTSVLMLYFAAVSASFVLLIFLMNGAVELEGGLIKAHQLCGATFWRYQIVSLRYDAVFLASGACLAMCTFVFITRGAFFGYGYEAYMIFASCLIGILAYLIARAALNYVRYWLLRGGGNAVSRTS